MGFQPAPSAGTGGDAYGLVRALTGGLWVSVGHRPAVHVLVPLGPLDYISQQPLQAGAVLGP